MPVRMILDVDTGIDDALALAFAVREPAIHLEAVLTVAGNVGLDLTTRNTIRVLDWLGAHDVPSCAARLGRFQGGSARPAIGTVMTASAVPRCRSRRARQTTTPSAIWSSASWPNRANYRSCASRR